MENLELNAVVIINTALKNLQRDLQDGMVNTVQMGGSVDDITEIIDELIIPPHTHTSTPNYDKLNRSCQSLLTNLRHPQLVLLSELMNSLLKLTKDASVDYGRHNNNIVQLTGNIRQVNDVMLNKYLTECRNINALPI